MTSLADQEAQIVADLTTIRELWDHMLPTIKAIPMGLNGGSRPTGARTSMGKSKEDNSDKNTNVDNLDILMSDRREITDALFAWAATARKAFNLSHNLPQRHDVHKMCDFLDTWTRHMTGHPEAEKYAQAVHWSANRVLRHAKPVDKVTVSEASRVQLEKRQKQAATRSMKIGDCPIEVPDADGGQRVCGGDVIAYLDDGDARDPRCRSCGTVAVIGWWQSHILGNPEAKPLVTADELIAIVVFHLHWTISHAQIRQWAARGKIERAGKDSKGRTLYDHAAVVGAIGNDVGRQRKGVSA